MPRIKKFVGKFQQFSGKTNKKYLQYLIILFLSLVQITLLIGIMNADTAKKNKNIWNYKMIINLKKVFKNYRLGWIQFLVWNCSILTFADISSDEISNAINKNEVNNRHHIAIVGMGPRGIYALERLSALIEENPGKKEISLHLFESSEFGAGSTYATSQPEYLKLNTVASQITSYWDGNSIELGKTFGGPTLYDWLISSGEKIGPDDYPSRAQHGRYLVSTFESLIKNLPKEIRLQTYNKYVQDIVPLDVKDGLYAIHTNGSNETVLTHKVLLTTGHSNHRFPQFSSLEEFAKSENEMGHTEVSFISNPFPLEKKISTVDKAQTIGIIGLGLTSIDVIISATVGKGGEFYYENDGRMAYRRSGREPKLIAWSRSGVPLSARAVNQKGVSGRISAKFLTPNKIDELRGKAKETRNSSKLEFEKEVFPLLLKEMEYVYYESLKGHEFAENYIKYSDQPLEQERLLIGIPVNDRFSWDRMSEPTKHREFTSESKYKEFLYSYLESEVREAGIGNCASPTKAACDVLRDLRDNLRYAVDFGGLTPASHRRFDREFTPINNRISVGPPAFRYEQMIALIDAGLLDLMVGPDPSIRPNLDKHAFEISGLGNPRLVQVLVNGILPVPRLETDLSILAQNLLKRKMMRFYENRIDDNVYVPGGVDINQKFQLIDAEGLPSKGISLLGVPAEGTLLYTTIAARPQVNSRALGDAGRWALRTIRELRKKE